MYRVRWGGDGDRPPLGELAADLLGLLGTAVLWLIILAYWGG